MFLYKVGYVSYEECPSVVLSHERDITPSEFDEMCLSCSESIVREMLAKNESASHFDHIWDRVVELMIERHGFVPVQYAGDFRPFGWASMLDKDDWKNDRGGDLDKLADRMIAAGLGRRADS